MDTALRAGVAVLERAVAFCLGSVSLVTPALLSRPTPCAAWDLRDLLAHLIDSMAAIEEAASGRVSLVPLPDAAEVIATARERAARLVGAWAHACGAASVRAEEARLNAPLLAGAGAIELAVHGWDVARACGDPRPIPAALADELLDLAVVLVRPGDRPGRFDRPRPAPPGASPGDQLLSFLGRAP
ncbi:TIGR03086 family metal-binding protein [Actinoplanes sp. CA-030573]|uniref:TIGR03086 family metal-binding protein n=1 Tax=Actinoplanes sp. CA-030573 TaxID=3239898 RepID=UPI003D9223D4